ERARRQADADAGRNALPGLAAVGAAHDVAAQAVGDDDAVLADESEQRSRIGKRQRREASAVTVELEQQALLAGDEELAADAAHRVEMQALRVVGGMEERLPGLAAVAGAQHQAERADDDAVLGIVEPDVEKRVFGALRREALRLGEPLVVAALGVVSDEDVAQSAAVELARPAAAGVGA